MKNYKDLFEVSRNSNYRRYQHGKFVVVIRFDQPQVLIFKDNEEIGFGIRFKYYLENCIDKVTDIMCEIISETPMNILYENFEKVDPEKYSPTFKEVDILEIMIGEGVGYEDK